MVENRWQVILGGLVLLIMLLIGTFSTGVYVGRHGFSRDGLRYAPGQPSGPSPDRPPQGEQPLLQLQPDLVGLVRVVRQDRLDLATRDGPRSIALNSNTEVFNIQSQLIDLGDLRPGDLVGVYGQIQDMDGNQFLAVRILQLPKQLLNSP